MHNYKYLEILILLTLSIVSQEKNTFLHAIHHDSIPFHILSMYHLLNGPLAEFLAILEKFFISIINTTSTPGGGGGEPGSGWKRPHQY